MRQRLAHLILGLWFAVGAAAFAQTATNLPGVKPLSAPGIHNLFALDRRLYSGSSPEGDEAFAALKKLGVKTIISVDGAKPEVERAAKFGLRYIHLPFGYDGIARTNVVRLLKAAQTVAGVIYVHCHHGLHRGPAAAADLRGNTGLVHHPGRGLVARCRYRAGL